jgi:hypothetical protein
MSEGDSWVEVRRSVSAQHVEGVPDEATVYLCYSAQERHITVYSAEGGYFAVLGVGSDIRRVIELDAEVDVEDRAQEIRDQWSDYVEEPTPTAYSGGGF